MSLLQLQEDLQYVVSTKMAYLGASPLTTTAGASHLTFVHNSVLQQEHSSVLAVIVRGGAPAGVQTYLYYVPGHNKIQ